MSIFKKDKNQSYTLQNVRFSFLITFVFLMAIIILSLISYYAFGSFKSLIDYTLGSMTENQELTLIYEEKDSLENHLELYLSTGEQSSLAGFHQSKDTITELVQSLEENTAYTESNVKIINVIHMIRNYLETAEKTVIYKSEKEIDKYVEQYSICSDQSQRINVYIKEIMSDGLVRIANRYDSIKENIDSIYRRNYSIYIFISILVAVLLVCFGFAVTKPIARLAESTKEIVKNKFDISFERTNSTKEISILIDSVEYMMDQLKEHLSDLKNKQKLELQLNQEKLENLKMKNALQEAELLALQSQINPHFMYNTMNIGIQLASLNGDEQTARYFYDVTEMFRYNLKDMNENTTLNEEINHVISYTNLLKVRFEDKITFKFDIQLSEEKLSILVPRLILQPLVENAYIHGISTLGRGGTIGLSAAEDTDCIFITVYDDGVGISPDTIDVLLHGDTVSQPVDSKRHTTGIGVRNVKKRLELFYHTQDIMHIQRRDGITEFILRLMKTSVETY